MFKNTKEKAMGALRKVNDGLNKKGFGVTKVDKTVAPNTTEKFNRVGFGKLGSVSIPRGEIEWKRPQQREGLRRALKPMAKMTRMDPSRAKRAPIPRMKQYGDKGYKPSNGVGVGY
jgi:hypothetical protein